MFFQWLSTVFSRGPRGKALPLSTSDTVMIFDGDQTTKVEFKALFPTGSAADRVETYWVQNSICLPRFLNRQDVEKRIAPSIGKESVDKLIAMVIVDICHKQPQIKRVIVVSSDGDFVDIIETAGIMFPEKRFIQMVNAEKPLKKGLRTAAGRLIGTNRAVHFYRVKQKDVCS